MKNFIYLLIIVLCFSCKSDNDPVIANAEIKFTSFDSSSKSWIVLSDADGKVILWKALVNGEQSSFSFPVTSNKNTCTLTHIWKTTSTGDLQLRTFAEVGAGDYFYKPEDAGSGSSIVTHTIISTDRSEFEEYHLSSDGCGVIEITDSDTHMTLCDTENNLFGWFRKRGDDIPRYLFKKMDAGETTQIDLALYATLPQMKSKEINFGRNIFGLFTLTGITPSGRNITVYTSEINTLSQYTATVYYPDLLSFFETYTTEFYHSDPFYGWNPGYTNYKQSTEPSINSDIQASIDKAEESPFKLSFKKNSGTAQYIEASGTFSINGTTTKFGSWKVYLPFEKEIEINLPQFPSDIQTEAGLSGFEYANFLPYSVGQDDDLSGYADFYNQQLKGPGVIQTKNAKIKTYWGY